MGLYPHTIRSLGQQSMADLYPDLETTSYGTCRGPPPRAELRAVVFHGRLKAAMSAPLLALRAAKPTHPLRAIQQSIRHAGGFREENVSDPKVEIIRRTLYPTNLRNRESPTGGWRPTVGRRLQRAIPSVQAHETIERAWFLHKRHVRRARQAELERKFNCMKQAMETLRELDTRLYTEANVEEDPRQRSELELETLKTLKGGAKRAVDSRIRGLFPRELRIPTDTPSRNGWNHDWSPIIRPLS